MIGAVLLFVSGVVVQGTLHRLVLTHVFARADLFPVMILAENALTLAAVPLWLRLSNRIQKHRAIALAALWIALFSLVLPFFPRDSAPAFSVWMALRGSSFASILFLWLAMLGAGNVADMRANRAELLDTARDVVGRRVGR